MATLFTQTPVKYHSYQLGWHTLVPYKRMIMHVVRCICCSLIQVILTILYYFTGSRSEDTLKRMSKYIQWIRWELYYGNEIKHHKSVGISFGYIGISYTTGREYRRE